MTAQDLTIVFSVPVAAENVVSSINNVPGWWATNVTGNSSAYNDAFTVRFGKTYSDMRVSEIIPSKKIVWRITDCDLPLFENPKEWLGTTITWELEEKSEQTLVRMTHKGLVPGVSCYEDCKKGWTFYVTESLQKLIIEGKGLPGTGIFSYIVVHDKRYEGLLYFKDDPLPDFPNEAISVDVKETIGEQVTRAYSVHSYHHEKFDRESLRGEYFMILKDSPLPVELREIKESLLIN